VVDMDIELVCVFRSNNSGKIGEKKSHYEGGQEESNYIELTKLKKG